MAEIRPFRAWRYNDVLGDNINELSSPLFDVVSDKQRQALYENPLNSIHLSVPLGPEPAENAAQTLQAWKDKGVLRQDRLPAIYPYYQYFRLPGQTKEFCRKGFICHIKAYDWTEGELLRHENTLPDAVNDRVELLEKTLLNSSATHGLYTDANFELEKIMDEVMTAPIYETEDYQGVRDVLGVVHDADAIKRFMQVVSQTKVLLADGHHRYEGSLLFRKKMMAANPNHTGNEAYNFHLMYLTNTESDDLRILPTHRLISEMPVPLPDMLEKLKQYFTIKVVENPYELNEVITGKRWAFGLYADGKAYKIRLKPEVHSQITWQQPDAVKDLDLTVLHYFVLEQVLGIPHEEQRSSKQLTYVKNFTECISKVNSGEAKIAFITNEVSMDQVKQVCYSGAIMPQKSTFFYPKVICGFLFSSIHPDEFESPFTACL